MKAVICLSLLVVVAFAVDFADDAQCTSFCQSYTNEGGSAQTNCTSTYGIYSDEAACKFECMKWPITSTCDQSGPGCAEAASENSYDCRLYHLNVGIAGSSTDRDIHCPHATPLSSETESDTPDMGACLDTPSYQAKSGLIQDLCNNVVASCSGLGLPMATMDACYNAMAFVPGIDDLTGYPSEANPFPISAQPSANNVICRRYHAYAAATAPDPHCSHAFTGNGLCGSNCDYYCDLIQGACTGDNEQYATREACMNACGGGGGMEAFPTVSFIGGLPTTGNTLNCRIYHVVVAAQSEDLANVHCPHAGAISTKETCGTSGAFTATASLFLVALLAFFSLN